MHKWLGVSAVVGLVGGVVMACSSTAASPYPDVASFCSAKAKAECQVADTCAVSKDACQSARSTQCNTDAAAARQSGTRNYNANNAQACIDAVNAAYAQNKVLYKDLFGNGSMGDKCNRVFEGTADKNKACTSDYDCTNSRVCSPVAAGSTSKVCADRTDKAKGDFCADPGSVCAAGTFCAVVPNGAPQCTAKQQTGQACTDAQPCDDTLRCSGGTCTARAQTGEACATNDDCSPNAGYCDAYAGNICTVGLTFATGATDCAGFGGKSTPPVDAGNPADTGGPGDSGGGG